MRWEGNRQSDNVIDLRDKVAGAGGATLGIGGTIVVLMLACCCGLCGGDPEVFLKQLDQDGGQQPASQRQTKTKRQTKTAPPVEDAPAGEDRMKAFVSTVLADTEDVWNEQLPKQARRPYVEPKLVIFSDRVSSACGLQSSAVGPFYCPADQQVYIDLTFYDDMAQQLNAPGDFAQAYVIGHEVGHHIQNLTGVSRKVAQMSREGGGEGADGPPVRQELQADCYAGVWAHHAQRVREVLEPGDLDEALNAASAIGDDTLQRRGGGAVMPETFTHGSAAQRKRWFKAGFDSGLMDKCDTFRAKRL
jgi:predicted metalloprotease